MVLMRRVPSIVLLALLGSACSSDDSPPSEGGGGQGTGGTPQGGTAGAKAGSGGLGSTGGSVPVGGMANTGGGGKAGAGQGGSGGASGSAGQAAGGSSAGAAGAAGGSAGSGGSGAVMESAGCGKMRTLQNGDHTIQFNGASRKYILKVPDGYSNSHPYRLVFAFAESGASATKVAGEGYFDLANLDSMNTIFVAPDAVGSTGMWSKTDVELTDDILTQLEGDLCIDKTRIFATGFSFGGAMSMALACTRADVFRGVAFFSGADLTGSCPNSPATLTKPIAYYASQASQDSTGAPSPMSGRTKQAEFAAVNGCMPEPMATTFPSAGQPHTCTEYKGCSAGHPTKYCVFEGVHGWKPVDPGAAKSWNAPEAWKFITQF